MEHGKCTLIMANKKGALEFWSSKLQAAEPCILTLSTRSTAAPSSSTIEAVTIDLEEIRNSRSEYFNACNTSTSAILMTAWGMVLRTYTDSDDICFAHAFTTRQKPTNGHEALNRNQVNILPFILQFEGDETLLETVRKAQLDLNDAQSNQDVSLAETCSHMGMETNALFNTCMLFSSDEQTPPGAELDISAQEVTLMEGCSQVRPQRCKIYARCANIFSMISLFTYRLQKNAFCCIRAIVCQMIKLSILRAH